MLMCIIIIKLIISYLHAELQLKVTASIYGGNVILLNDRDTEIIFDRTNQFNQENNVRKKSNERMNENNLFNTVRSNCFHLNFQCIVFNIFLKKIQ